jgi:hypothetical protein
MLEYLGGKGGMDSKCYQDQVLESVLRAFYMQMNHERQMVYFQQDNALSHCSKSTMKWLSKNKISLFKPPASSPDLNSIEPVWLNLKNSLHHLTHCLSTVEQLRAVVINAWEQLPMEQIDGHTWKMGDCIEAVLKAKGGHTTF